MIHIWIHDVFAYLHDHPHLLDGIIIIAGAMVAACLIWRFALRPWLVGVRYARRSCAHARPAPLADPVWGDTGQHDAAFAEAVASYDYDHPVDRCISCGAEVDHYLGCPDDPSPDYEAEAETMLHCGSLLEPLPDPYAHPYARSWEQERPVRTVNLPPWETEAPRLPAAETRQMIVDSLHPERWEGRDADLTVPVSDPEMGARPARPGDGSRDSQPDLPGHAETTQGTVVTAAGCVAGEPDLPGPSVHALSGEKVRRARKPRRLWSGLLGAPDPQNLLVPAGTVSPAPAAVQSGGLPGRDEQPDRAGQEGTGVLTGAIHPGPPPADGDDEPATVTISIISIDAGAGPWQDDGWAAALPGYIAEHLPDGCSSTDEFLDALFDGIADSTQLALTGAT